MPLSLGEMITIIKDYTKNYLNGELLDSAEDINNKNKYNDTYFAELVFSNCSDKKSTRKSNFSRLKAKTSYSDDEEWQIDSFVKIICQELKSHSKAQEGLIEEVKMKLYDNNEAFPQGQIKDLSVFLKTILKAYKVQRNQRDRLNSEVQRWLNEYMNEQRLESANDDPNFTVIPSILTQLCLISTETPNRLTTKGEKHILISNIIEEIKLNEYMLMFIVGEAGVGKTVTSKLICEMIINEQYSIYENDVNKFLYIPFCISLREWNDSIDLEVWLEKIKVEMNKILALLSYKKQIILVFDGLNEISETQIPQLVNYIHKSIINNIFVLITSRPMIEINDLFWDNVISQKKCKSYELLRWSDKQLKSYFYTNNYINTYDLLPSRIKNILKLPLLASLFVKSIDSEEIRNQDHLDAIYIESEIQIFNQMLRASLASIRTDVEGVCIEEWICRVAYNMTKLGKLTVDGSFVIECIKWDDIKSNIKTKFLYDLVRSGLMKYSDSTITTKKINIRELNTSRNNSFSFLHQAVQEYLTAKYLINNSYDIMPTHLSDKAFWYEIPLIMLRILQDSNKSNKESEIIKLIDKILAGGDILTAARLYKELPESREYYKIRNEIIESINKNLSEGDTYHNTIEALETLQTTGKDILREAFTKSIQISDLYALYEGHIINREKAGARENDWRIAARAIYYAGEIGNELFIPYLDRLVDSSCSLHLYCHIFEALKRNAKVHEAQKIAEKIIKKQKHDILQCYYYTITKKDSTIENSEKDNYFFLEKAENLSKHILCIENPYFKDEFWLRAHGVIALLGILDTEQYLSIILKLFKTEDYYNYEDHEIVGYKLVHSSITKALFNVCDQIDIKHPILVELLTYIFTSKRIPENGWAIRHIERLLRSRFSSNYSRCKVIQLWGNDNVSPAIENVFQKVYGNY